MRVRVGIVFSAHTSCMNSLSIANHHHFIGLFSLIAACFTAAISVAKSRTGIVNAAASCCVGNRPDARIAVSALCFVITLDTDARIVRPIPRRAFACGSSDAANAAILLRFVVSATVDTSNALSAAFPAAICSGVASALGWIVHVAGSFVANTTPSIGQTADTADSTSVFLSCISCMFISNPSKQGVPLTTSSGHTRCHQSFVRR